MLCLAGRGNRGGRLEVNCQLLATVLPISGARKQSDVDRCIIMMHVFELDTSEPLEYYNPRDRRTNAQ